MFSVSLGRNCNVVLPAPVPSSDVSDVVGGRKQLQFRLFHGRALDAALPCSLRLYFRLATAEVASQNKSAEDVMEEDTFYSVFG